LLNVKKNEMHPRKVKRRAKNIVLMVIDRITIMKKIGTND
jgi:hypothetical protein